MLLRLVALALLLPLAACATSQARPDFDRTAALQVLQRAATHVRGCYRAPRVPRPGRHIVTHLRVRFAPSGALLGLPEVVRQDGVTPANQLYAPRMAEAAIASVIRCTPIALPPELHTAWQEFELTFAPGASA